MEFKQYGGLLTDWMLLSLASSIAFVWYGSYLWLGMGGGWKSLLIALGVALATAVLSRLAILAEIRGRGGSSGDMIIMDGEGVRLKQKGEVSLSIAWEDITAITKSRRLRRPAMLRVSGSRGESLHWYPADRSSQNYMLEQHPELAKLLKFDFR